MEGWALEQDRIVVERLKGAEKGVLYIDPTALPHVGQG